MSQSITAIPREKFKDYPLLARLLELQDIPETMYISGELPDITIDEYGRATPRILTVVGSRSYTSYGKQALEKLIGSLAGENVIILSGLALGIDGLSHITALKNNITTIAIPGSGIDLRVIHPRTNLDIAQEILIKHGALLSEFAPDTRPAKWTFAMRNRIMAALSDAVLLIEAREKSGTLITARMALELGRDIGAVPGEIFNPSSFGTNELIKNGAYLISSSDDLYALLHLSKKEKENIAIDYSDDERKILEILKEPTEKDLLMIQSSLSPEIFLMTLSSLEIKGVIEETFGEVRRIV
jgi:DNA processing protein